MPNDPNPPDVNPPSARKFKLQNGLHKLKISLPLVKVLRIPTYTQEINYFFKSPPL